MTYEILQTSIYGRSELDVIGSSMFCGEDRQWITSIRVV